ncbi:pyrroloquinoline quinone precursor peptide PqqA [Pollutimonas subterranea]|uniref:Coenzyme PQQ synthesis protein A n=1 Tax=Pollutimonas subterranea TaxID=2045210 RepID=A0A2N4U9I2_9BURK|nr:pyrroloquinoline quinone precursor peptide PqqA [Pollutimonas subterranea]
MLDKGVPRDIIKLTATITAQSNGWCSFRSLEKSHVVSPGDAMKWSKPEFSDLRFGFEITMYIANR